MEERSGTEGYVKSESNALIAVGPNGTVDAKQISRSGDWRKETNDGIRAAKPDNYSKL